MRKRLAGVVMVVGSWCASAGGVDVHLVDAQSGEPMTNTIVSATYEGWLALGHRYDEKYWCKTDGSGNCSFTGTNGNPSVFICVHSERERRDFYESTHRVKLHPYDVQEPNPNEHHSVTIRVQRVMNKIPMFVKDVKAENGRADFFAKGSDTARYDMMVGDWLPPQGTGTVADVVFTRLPEEPAGLGTNVCNREVRLTRLPLKVEFPGEGNGIAEVTPLQDSELMVRTAPEGGYVRTHMSYEWVDENGIRRCSWRPKGTRAYCFRIRTKRDANGRMEEGYYGKLRDGFMFSSARTEADEYIPIASLCFQYYLNLTSLDRNQEFDWDKNLNPQDRQ